jgi:UrcA family protein
LSGCAAVSAGERHGKFVLIGAAAIAGCVLQMAVISAQADSMQHGSGTGSSHAALDGPRRMVNYSDLDLSRPEGINTLEAPISRAVESVCEQSGDRSLKGTGL